MPARSGKQYLQAIDRLGANIWVDGKKVSGNISDHPSLKGVMKSTAKLYDVQLLKENQDIMTFKSPSTGSQVGTSFMKPSNKEDLEKRRLSTQLWAKESGGLLGRSPDYMNTVMMAFASSSELFSLQDNRFTKNMNSLFEKAREDDLCFTHTFINPQVNRASHYIENFSQTIAAQTIDIKKDGIIIQGARLLATQGGITDEILVYPSGGAARNPEMAYGFSIPSNTPGLKFISREPYSYRESVYDHPLSSRFDELDMIVVFDHVLVPWERVFFYQNPEIASKAYQESSFHLLAVHQVTSRRIVKLEFLLGIAKKLIETIQVGEYAHIHEKISEMKVGVESLKALVLAGERNASLDKWGVMVPDNNPMDAAVMLFPRLYPRFIEIIQLIGASGLVALPTSADFSSEIRDDLDLYMQAATVPAEERVKIFRLAWDMTMSAFGSRQTLYERFFFGDAIRLATGHYFNISSNSSELDMVNQFLGSYED
ncbi:4-hydroxyphenylacetate 3-monooxygenase, oxygenase component [Pradoshia sp.]